MKSTNLFKLAAPILLLISGTAFAQTIVGTAHDMTAAGTYDNDGNTGGQICVYCHTPHNATAIAGGPLWNRLATSAGPFVMYPMGGTITGTVDSSPNPETIACLGCHDGTIAIDNISNLPGRDPDVLPTWTPSVGPMTGFAVLDLDLSNDHPVSITYDPSLDTGLNTQVAAEAAGLQFFSTNKVECATCHDVHGTLNAQFLRADPDGSVICLACHNK